MDSVIPLHEKFKKLFQTEILTSLCLSNETYCNCTQKLTNSNGKENELYKKPTKLNKNKNKQPLSKRNTKTTLFHTYTVSSVQHSRISLSF